MKWMNNLLVVAAALGAIGAQAQNQAGYKWQSVPMGGGGYISGVYPAKGGWGVVYARTDVGGAYRYDPSAAKWTALNDALNSDNTGLLSVDSLAVDPKSPWHIVMLAGNKDFSNGRTMIMRSTDYGKSFAYIDVTKQFKTNGNEDGRHVERLVFDPGSSNVIYAGTRNNGLFRSTDWGYNWTRLNLDVTTTFNNSGISVVALDPSSVKNGVAQRMIVGVSRGTWAGPNLYRSEDGGASFFSISGNDNSVPGWLFPQHAAFDDKGNVYITYGNGAGPYGGWKTPDLKKAEPMNAGGVWKYDLNHWWFTNITPPNISSAFGGISVDPNNSQRLITSTLNQYLPQGGGGEGERVFVSANGGNSWTTVLGADSTKSTNGIDWIKGGGIHWGGTVVFDPYNSQTAWITSGNGLFKSSNLGDARPDWTFDVKGIEETVVLEAVSAPGGPLTTALGDVGGFQHRNSYQYGTMVGPNLGTTTGVTMASSKPWLMARVGAGGMQMSSDWGTNWGAIKSANLDAGYQAWKGKLTLSADGAVLLHGPENAATSYRSDNWGASWVKVGNLDIYGAQPVADATNAKMFYAYDSSNGKFWISYDTGWSFWASGSVLPTGGSKRIGVPPGYGGEVWVPLYGGGLMRSTDSGKSFVKSNNISYCGAIGFGKAADGKNYPTIFIWATVNGTTGLFRSTDVGNSWLRVNDDDHQYGTYGAVVTGDMNNFGVVYMSTAGRGLAVGSP